MSSRKYRHILARTEAALRDSDADLSEMFDSFTARVVGQAMPESGHHARRVVRPLAVLVFVIGTLVATTVTAFAISGSPPCTGVAFNPKAPQPAIGRAAHPRVPATPSCQVRVPARPGTAR